MDQYSSRTNSIGRTLSRAISAVIATIAILAASMFIASPASAHGGPIGAQAGPNGGGGVYVYIFYERDLHAVDELSGATVEGTLDGQTVGPIDLVASTTQPGRWETPSDTFADGRWSLTVRYVEHGKPGLVKDPVQVNVTGGSSASMASADVAAASIWPFALAGGIAVAVVVAVVAIGLRRRARSHVTG